MKIFATLGAFALAALVSSASAQPAAPIVHVTGGEIRGGIEAGQGVFKNIPFAAPPVGQNRWREPQPVSAWSGTRDATRFGPACVQPQAPNPSEDCLQLNIWTPEWPVRSPKAVMVWFHGGGNTEGWDSTPFFWGSDLARHGVIFVSAQYRLGVFGFFAHPELTRESPHHASGDYGLMDQVAALKWVRDNIAAFGGDPKNVTIFGESAGAEDVGLLMVSPLSQGLFAHAIAESGPLRRFYPTLAEHEKDCAKLAAALDAPGKDQLAFLRKMDAHALMATAFANDGTCRPVNIDGYVITEQPLKTYAEGHQHAVPFMLGNTLREGFGDITSVAELRSLIARQYGDMAPRVMAAYGLDKPQGAPDPLYGNALIQYGTDHGHRCRVELTGLQHAAIGEPFYQFQFSRDLPGQVPTDSTHTDELFYVFGQPAWSRKGLTAPEHVKLSDQIETYWTNFARTGDPNGPGLPQWTRFDAAKKSYMSFTANGPVGGEFLRQAQCALFLDAEAKHPTWQNPDRAWR